MAINKKTKKVTLTVILMSFLLGQYFFIQFARELEEIRSFSREALPMFEEVSSDGFHYALNKVLELKKNKYPELSYHGVISAIQYKNSLKKYTKAEPIKGNVKKEKSARDLVAFPIVNCVKQGNQAEAYFCSEFMDRERNTFRLRGFDTLRDELYYYHVKTSIELKDMTTSFLYNPKSFYEALFRRYERQ